MKPKENENNHTINEPNTIHVIAATDDRYAQHAGVMAASLFAHKNSSNVQLHVLVPPDFSSRSRLETVPRNGGGLAFHVLSGAMEVNRLKQRADITSATYYRLLMTEVVPSDIERAIYLDCDIIVRDGLSDLWTLDLGSKIVGAVIDPGFDRQALLGLPSAAPYFNAGVLLIDLAQWRRENIGRQALEFAETNPERLTFNDQCALNWILRSRWMALDRKWNMMTQYLGKATESGFEFSYPLSPVGRSAKIVHFNEPGRPWLYMSDHPFKQEYLRHLAVTPWRDYRPPDRYPHNVIVKNLARYAPVLLPGYLAMRRIM